jgi:4-amino-4-deoxy-L-arabinose transferase-like glycosyltransferase
MQMTTADRSHEKPSHETWAPHFTRLDWLLLLVVFAIAVFFRLWLQGKVPPGMNFDEAFESLEARRLLTEPNYRPIFFTGNWGIPPLEIYLTALAFLVAGEQMLAIRYVSAVAGIVTIVLLYLLARTLFPLPSRDEVDASTQAWGDSTTVRQFLPFVACLVLAVLPWHNAFSREGVEVVLVPLWAILAVLFLWSGFQSRRWWPFLVSGFFFGSAFYTYQAAWVLPGVLVLFIVYKLFQERGFIRCYGWKLLLLALTAALIFLPLGIFAYHNPGMFVMRTGQVGVFGSGGGSQTPVASLANNVLKVAGVFVTGGWVADGNKLYIRPPMPLALAVVLYLGLAVALVRFKRAEYALLLIWFVWMWLPSVMSDDAPNIRRMIGSTPPMAILIALGIGWLFDAARARTSNLKQWRSIVPAAVGVALGGLLIYTTVWSYQYFFVDWGRAKNLYHIFDVGLVDIGKFAAATPRDTHLYYTPADDTTVTHLPVVWQLRDRHLPTFNGRHGVVLAPPGPRGSLYLITAFMGDTWTLPALQKFYPGGRVVQEARNPYGVLHSSVFAVGPNAQPAIRPQAPLDADFGGQIRLLGSDLSAAEISPGETLTITLYWQPRTAAPMRDYTVFTHLLGPVNPANGTPVWAGQDSPPLGNSYPTSRWQQGEVIVDRHELVLPVEIPAGTYPIEVGLYDPQAGGTRLNVLDAAEQPQGDKIIIGEIKVR